MRTLGCPPPGLLEAASAGERTSAEVAQHLGSCPSCRATISELQTDRDAYLSRFPPGPFRRKIIERAALVRTKSPWRLWPALAAPALVAAAYFVLAAGRTEDVRLKGPRLQIITQRADGSQTIGAVRAVRRDEPLRLAYRAPEDGYLLVLNVDGRGTVQALYPQEGFAAKVSATDSPLLPGAFALDDSPGPEFFIAIFQAAPFSLESLRGRISPRGQSPPSVACGECRLEILTIEKTP